MRKLIFAMAACAALSGCDPRIVVYGYNDSPLTSRHFDEDQWEVPKVNMAETATSVTFTVEFRRKPLLPEVRR